MALKCPSWMEAQDPCFPLQAAGIVDQDEKKKFIKVLKEVRVERDDAYAFINHLMALRFHFQLISIIQYKEDSLLNQQSIFHRPFVREVCRARTFGFNKDVEMLQKITSFRR